MILRWDYIYVHSCSNQVIFQGFFSSENFTGILVKVSGRYIPEVFIYLLSVISLAFEIDERPKRIFPSFKLAKLKFGKKLFEFSSNILFFLLKKSTSKILIHLF